MNFLRNASFAVSFLLILAFGFFPSDDNLKRVPVRPTCRIGFNDQGEILAPWQDDEEREWHYFDAVFEIQIPVVEINPRSDEIISTGDFRSHTLTVVFTEEIDRTAFRENYFWQSNFAKTEELFRQAVNRHAKDENWFWNSQTGEINAPDELRCWMIP